MANSPNLALPLLAAGQAQKHVTVNDALLRVDALTQASVKSATIASPPENAVDGDSYIVPPNATDAWFGQDGELALHIGGGWDFLSPQEGWRVWVADEAQLLTRTADAWRGNHLSPVKSGAFIGAKTLTSDEPVIAGLGFDTSILIPDRAVVLGVSARVVEEITGVGLEGWRVGVSGFPDRYGTGIGLNQNASLVGITGAPVGYYGDTQLRIEPEGGDFDGGLIRLAIHYYSISAPDPV